MRSLKLLAIFGLLSALAVCASASYFFLDEGKMRCFYEDLPESVPVAISYKCPEIGFTRRRMYAKAIAGEGPVGGNENLHNHPFGVRLQVSDPSGNEIANSILDNAEGSVSLSTTLSGQYSLCLTTNTSHWFRQAERFQFEMTIETGADARDYTQVAKKDELDAMEVLLRKLNDKVVEIKKEQSYFKERERLSRNTSESTNGRVAWLTLFQIVGLTSVGLWQAFSFRGFLVNKKVA